MKPGDKLYLVERIGTTRTVTVESVSRRWATMVGRRGWNIDRGTGQVISDGCRVGMVYASEAAYREQRAIDDAWRVFQLGVQRRTADGLTVKQIAEATAWLGVEA
jgi:hypothetical protein